MKSSKWIWIGMTLLVIALTATVIGVNYWYHSGSIRIAGDDIRVEFEGIGYIFDGETGEITGQTPVTLIGKSKSTDSEVFEGELDVLAYPNEETGTITSDVAVKEIADGYWIIRKLDTCLHYETTENERTEAVRHFCNYVYSYYFRPDNPDFLVVCIESYSNGGVAYVVLADSEEKATENYNWFMENEPEI